MDVCRTSSMDAEDHSHTENFSLNNIFLSHSAICIQTLTSSVLLARYKYCSIVGTQAFL